MLLLRNYLATHAVFQEAWTRFIENHSLTTSPKNIFTSERYCRPSSKPTMILPVLEMIDRKLEICVADGWAALSSTLGIAKSERFAANKIVA